MLTRQQHRFAIYELARELHGISQDIKKNIVNMKVKLEVWKDHFWDDIFFYYLFNYDKISDFDQYKNHYSGDIIDLDENVSESIWDIIIRVCYDIIYDIRHYEYTTCINAVHKMIEKTFEE